MASPRTCIASQLVWCNIEFGIDIGIFPIWDGKDPTIRMDMRMRGAPVGSARYAHPTGQHALQIVAQKSQGITMRFRRRALVIAGPVRAIEAMFGARINVDFDVFIVLKALSNALHSLH